MSKHKAYAILSTVNGETHIVGIMVPGLGQSACVNSKRETIEMMWKLVAPEVQKTARIAELVEQ